MTGLVVAVRGKAAGQARSLRDVRGCGCRTAPWRENLHLPSCAEVEGAAQVEFVVDGNLVLFDRRN